MSVRTLCAVLLVALVAAGCGSGSADSKPPTPATPAATPTTTPGTAASDAVVSTVVGSGTPVPLPDDPQTAVPAAEEVRVAGTSPKDADSLDFVDLSDAAKQSFAAWVAYEIWEPSYSQGAEQDLTAGIAACVWRSKGETVDRVAELVRQEMGYVLAGATAVLRGALEALCPSLNLGFRTAFDKDVDRFAQQVAAQVNFAPPPPVFYEYGRFMKAVCHAYDDPAVGRGGMHAWVRAQTDSNTLTLARPHADDAALTILVEQATLVGCVNHF